MECKDNQKTTEDSSAMASVIREILRTPAFKDLIMLELTGSSSASARELLRTLLWEDPALFFSLLDALPRHFNFTVEFLDELGKQLNRIPSEILWQYLSQMGADVDKDSLQNLAQTFTALTEKLIVENTQVKQHLRGEAFGAINSFMATSANAINRLGDKEAFGEDAGNDKGVDPEVLGILINSLAGWITRTVSKKPDFFRTVASKTDPKTMRGAFGVLFNAFLDMGILKVSWIFGSLFSRIKEKITKKSVRQDFSKKEVKS